ncbi:MAG: hypothetical protein BGP12_03050 [Rhodospirillales bacterium 70-18]|nr:GTP-binding protein [Rhodospirillales bacterium]OJY64744.1 MAG: hypothetical protein BGP12_03050 [Rhodospirillales bacterium 70-18]
MIAPTLPLTIVGGFLGAGKTALVNHLLRTTIGRIGVLVNDFGALDVDAVLLAAGGGGVVALGNGCLCCCLGDDLATGLAMLAARGAERLVVEASGIADPWRIAQLALIEPGYALAPLVVVVDSAAFCGQLADPHLAPTLRRQLEFAEIVLLNKSDLADPAAAAAAVAAIRPQARLLPVSHGQAPPEALDFPPPRRSTSRLHADDPVHGFRTWLWPAAEVLDRDRLRALLAALPHGVLRVKGFCRLTPDGAPHLLQYAAERWAFAPLDGPPGLVVIGTPDMPGADALAALFAATRADAA